MPWNNDRVESVNHAFSKLIPFAKVAPEIGAYLCRVSEIRDAIARCPDGGDTLAAIEHHNAYYNVLVDRKRLRAAYDAAMPKAALAGCKEEVNAVQDAITAAIERIGTGDATRVCEVTETATARPRSSPTQADADWTQEQERKIRAAVATRMDSKPADVCKAAKVRLTAGRAILRTIDGYTGFARETPSRYRSHRSHRSRN